MFYILACFNLFTSFLCFITNTLPDTFFLGHIWVFVTNLAFSIRIHENCHKSIMITLYDLTNIQNKAQKAWEQFEKRQWRKFWFRQKSLGSDTDTETWSWFRLPIPKPGFGRTLIWYSEFILAVALGYCQRFCDSGNILVPLLVQE